MSIGVFGLAMGILLGSGWIGTTCLDEWQIGVLGIATGFVLFLTRSGKYSLDNYLMKNNYSLTKTKAFAWLGSGILPIRDSIFPKVVLIGSLLIFGMTLMTNQVFHGGLWGTLHNKSVKPKLEITETKISDDRLSFDVFRTEGVDVYGAWIIGLEVQDAQGQKIMSYTPTDLASMNEDSISNYYVAKVKPGQHSLVIPLGAKAKVSLTDPVLQNLAAGKYTLKLIDISGSSWVQEVTKR
jgi:thiosulfate dehydrogenase [quinone] large subunit